MKPTPNKSNSFPLETNMVPVLNRLGNKIDTV